MNNKLRALLIAAATVVGTGVSLGAEAATVSYGLDLNFSGTAPSGTGPWVGITIADTAANTVQVSITGVNLQSPGSGLTENVDNVYLNVDPALNGLLGPSGFTFNYVSGRSWASTTSGADQYKADGDGFFDLLFSFGTGNMGLMNGETSVYSITAAGLSSASFLFSSVKGGGTGTYYAAAHVQNTGLVGGTTVSGWIGASAPASAVPVPAAALLFLSGLGGLAGLTRRRAGQPIET